MAASSLAAIVRVPGRICINPSAIGTYPHGGTDLGPVDLVELEVERYAERATEEGFGSKVLLDKLEGGEDWRMRASLRGPEGGSIDKFFMQGSSSAIIYPNGGQPGTWLGDRAVKWLFVPRDPLRWAIYFKRAICSVDSAQKIAHHAEEDLGVPVLVEATPVDSGNAVQWRPIGSIVL